MPYGIANRNGQPDFAEVERMLKLARAAGVTTLDTARAYGNSEDVIGRSIAGDPYWRVFTKIHPIADSSDGVRDSLRASRQALRRPILDGVLLHRAEQRQMHGGGGVWDVLRRERDEGRIGVLGVSANTPEEAWSALEDSEIEWIQVACSLLDQRLYRAKFFERAREARKRIVIRSVFLQGAALLPVDDLPEHLQSLRETLIAVNDWANDRGVSRACVFLAFAAALANVWILLGCESGVQLARNLANWRDACCLADAIRPLADQIDWFPAEILTPSLWPQTAPVVSQGPIL